MRTPLHHLENSGSLNGQQASAREWQMSTDDVIMRRHLEDVMTITIGLNQAISMAAIDVC